MLLRMVVDGARPWGPSEGEAKDARDLVACFRVDAALDDVRRTKNEPVPMHLRNAPTGLMREMGYGKGYKYSHDHEDSFAPMQNLPDSLKGQRYYQPGGQGYEPEVADRLRKWWGEREMKKKGEDEDG